MRKPRLDGFPFMLVGYMRVSSDSDRQSTDLQRDALLAAGVDARHLFEDHASGAKDDRAGLARALEFVRPGDVLVVWKLDRLGRSLSHLLALVTSLKDKRVAFRSLTENLDTTTPSGEFLFQVFGALAQYERALIQERVVAGTRVEGEGSTDGGEVERRVQAGHVERSRGCTRRTSACARWTASPPTGRSTTVRSRRGTTSTSA